MKLMYDLGEKVRIVKDTVGDGYYIGTEGTIIDVMTAEGNTWYRVKLETDKVRNQDNLPFMAIEIEEVL